jgi:hypothetical protein
MPLCRNKSCKAKLPKGTLPQVCGDACKSAVYAQERDRKAARRIAAKSAAKSPKVKPRRKPKSIARLRNDVAELLQKLVRMKAADPITGMCQCVTCPRSLHWKEMQGGHFIDRGKGATKILEENIHPQCPNCNLWGMKKASTVLAYRRFMVDVYGEGFVKEIEALAQTAVKHRRHELEAMAFDVKRQIQEQEQRLSGHVSKPMESAAA